MSNEEDLVSLSQPLLQGEKKPKKPTNIQDSKLFKYSAFICIISLTFGSYFCFDTPAALPDKFKRDLGITTATFTDFYSWYNWPNVILCFFGGLLIDRVFGVRAGTILFSSLVLLGNLIFAIGALSKNITVMNIGRFIFGFLFVLFELNRNKSRFFLIELTFKCWWGEFMRCTKHICGQLVHWEEFEFHLWYNVWNMSTCN